MLPKAKLSRGTRYCDKCGCPLAEQLVIRGGVMYGVRKCAKRGHTVEYFDPVFDYLLDFLPPPSGQMEIRK